MTARSDLWPLHLARDALSKFLTFVREHSLFVEVAPPAYFVGYGLERPQRGGEAAAQSGGFDPCLARVVDLNELTSRAEADIAVAKDWRQGSVTDDGEGPIKGDTNFRK